MRRCVGGARPAGFVVGLAIAIASVAVSETRAAGPVCTVDPGGGGDYTTISAAVADLGCTTINVNAGTYNENVNVNHSVVIQGAGATTTVVDGGAAGDAFSVSANNITIDGFEIRNGYNGITGQTSNSVFSNNVIHDNLNILGSAGVGILLWGNNDGNQITNNQIYDNDRQGIFIGDCDFAGPSWSCTVATNISSANTIHGNTIHDNGLYTNANGPDASQYGIQLWNATGNTIEENEIYNHNTWLWTPTYPFGNGIYLCASGGNVIRRNTLHDNHYNVGVYGMNCGPSTTSGAGNLLLENFINAATASVGTGGVGVRVFASALEAGYASTQQVHFNSIVANANYGARNTDTGTVDAEGNWYGSATGPTHATNAGGTGQPVSDNVDYSPWLKSGTDCAPATPGFQVCTTYVVNPNNPPTYTTGGIQDGVDFATPGDAVEAVAGNYVEQVTIGKSLTVTGAGAGSSVIQAPAVLAGDANGSKNVVTITGAGVAVEVSGFTVSGPGPSSCNSLNTGLFVRDGASADIHDNAVSDIRDTPLGGCQSGVGILVGRLAFGTTGTATITDNAITGYQKGGVVVDNAGSSATIDGNTVTGIGPTTLNAQNGIQVTSGAAATVSNNEVHDNYYSPMTWCATGILVNGSDGVTVQGNVLDGNLCDLYASTDGSLIKANMIDPAKEWPFSVMGNNNDVQLNVVNGSPGVGVYVDGTGNSFTCNRITNNVGGFYFDSTAGWGTTAGTPNTVNTNSIFGNGVGVDASIVIGPPDIDAEDNWWGCVGGPGAGGCDTVTANVDYTPWATAVPTCVNCTADAQCDDGLTCTGTETCNLLSNMCQPGTPVDCSPFADQCNDAACTEPLGTCLVTPKINGFGCNDGDACTTSDTCQGGVCVGTGGADVDNDGYCDGQEIQAGCNANDAAEIPPQSNVYSGGKGSSGGEILLTYRAPSDRDVTPATDPSCATAGVCNLLTGFCTSGKVSDPCTANSDCNQAAGTCRVVINYAGVPDLLLLEVGFKKVGVPLVSLLPSFQPATPGCTRKVDVAVGSGFKRATLKFKASGTTAGRLRKDRDRIRYKE